MRREEDSFESLGLRAGAFILRPAIEAKAGYDTNPTRVVNGRGSSMWTVAPELLVRSDWQRHELRAEIRGSASAYDSFHSVNGQTFEAKVNGRIDVARQSRIDLEARSRTVSASPGNLDLPAGLARLPQQTTNGASIGGAHGFNRLEISLKNSFDRITWNSSRLTDGSVISNKDRAYDQYGFQLRGSYELTPGVKPFVEVGIDSRRHDLAFDTQGVARNSTGYFLKGGTSFELTRKLTGELAVGHIARIYPDPTLPNLQGLLTEASLVWTASALTTFKLTGRTTAEETILRGVSGLLLREAEGAVEHAFRKWLVGTVKLGYGTDAYVGSALEYRRVWAAAGMTYKLSRHMQLKAELRREWHASNTSGGDYGVTTLLAGLRLQR